MVKLETSIYNMLRRELNGLKVELVHVSTAEIRVTYVEPGAGDLYTKTTSYFIGCHFLQPLCDDYIKETVERLFSTIFHENKAAQYLKAIVYYHAFDGNAEGWQHIQGPVKKFEIFQDRREETTVLRRL